MTVNLNIYLFYQDNICRHHEQISFHTDSVCDDNKVLPKLSAAHENLFHDIINSPICLKNPIYKVQYK